MKKTITAHLNKLPEQFNDYFLEKQRDDNRIHDLFGVYVQSATLPSNEESQMLELSCGRMLQKKNPASPCSGAAL